MMRRRRGGEEERKRTRNKKRKTRWNTVEERRMTGAIMEGEEQGTSGKRDFRASPAASAYTTGNAFRATSTTSLQHACDTRATGLRQPCNARAAPPPAKRERRPAHGEVRSLQHVCNPPANRLEPATHGRSHHSQRNQNWGSAWPAWPRSRLVLRDFGRLRFAAKGVHSRADAGSWPGLGQPGPDCSRFSPLTTAPTMSPCRPHTSSSEVATMEQRIGSTPWP